MCRTESKLNEQVEGRLEEYYKKHEHESDSKLETRGKFLFKYLHIINFHEKDLPFTNLSVNNYARRFLNFAVEDENAIKVATTIHGPSAGIDASEALEVMIEALACELRTKDSIGNLQEILFIEKDKEIFNRLQSRLKYLESDKGLIKTEGNEIFLEPASDEIFKDLEGKLKQLSTKSLFIAMPFNDDFEDIYYYGIKKTIEDIGHKPERSDNENFTGNIVERIRVRIELSKMVVADITGNNPNVFYEVGFAHGINRQVVLISQEEELPFDLRNHRRILYRPTKIRNLETELKKLLKGILQH